MAVVICVVVFLHYILYVYFHHNYLYPQHEIKNIYQSHYNLKRHLYSRWVTFLHELSYILAFPHTLQRTCNVIKNKRICRNEYIYVGKSILLCICICSDVDLSGTYCRARINVHVMLLHHITSLFHDLSFLLKLYIL